MAGVDRNTGKPIEEPAHIRQSIDLILNTPAGTRVMRREFGVEYLNEDGSLKPSIDAKQIENIAAAAISADEPRVQDVVIRATFVDDRVSSISVKYTEIKSGDVGEVIVSYAD